MSCDMISLEADDLEVDSLSAQIRTLKKQVHRLERKKQSDTQVNTQGAKDLFCKLDPKNALSTPQKIEVLKVELLKLICKLDPQGDTYRMELINELIKQNSLDQARTHLDRIIKPDFCHDFLNFLYYFKLAHLVMEQPLSQLDLYEKALFFYHKGYDRTPQDKRDWVANQYGTLYENASHTLTDLYENLLDQIQSHAFSYKVASVYLKFLETVRTTLNHQPKRSTPLAPLPSFSGYPKIIEVTKLNAVIEYVCAQFQGFCCFFTTSEKNKIADIKKAYRSAMTQFPAKEELVDLELVLNYKSSPQDKSLSEVLQTGRWGKDGQDVRSFKEFVASLNRYAKGLGDDLVKPGASLFTAYHS